jgi:protease IV
MKKMRENYRAKARITQTAGNQTVGNQITGSQSRGHPQNSNINNNYSNIETQKGKGRTILTTVIITLVIVIFFVFFFIGCTFLLISPSSNSKEVGNVALISVDGVIGVGNSGGLFSPDSASSNEIVEYIKQAEADNSVKAIIIEINSPGGSGVASEEIANALQKSKKLKVAWIREIGTSGAYWVASASDHIIASKFSLTGSVGVLSSYLDFSQLLQRYNISYEKITGGQYKDIGSPYKQLTDDERLILQKKVDLLHTTFLNEITNNRNLSEAQRKEISDALYYTGDEALSLGLIDEIGGKEQAISYIERNLNITVKIKNYSRKKGLMDLFSELMTTNSFQLGRGIGSGIAEKQYYGKVNGPNFNT